MHSESDKMQEESVNSIIEEKPIRRNKLKSTNKKSSKKPVKPKQTPKTLKKDSNKTSIKIDINKEGEELL